MFIETQMRAKILTAAVRSLDKGSITNRAIVNRVADSAEKGIGMVDVKPWNARLSLRTYSNLQKQGVM